MSGGYVAKDVVLRGSSVTCAAGATTVVSDPIRISEADSKNFIAHVKFSAISEAAASTVTLQDSNDGGTTWAAVQTATDLVTVAEVNTLTFPAVGGLTASEYIAVYDDSGNPWCCMLDTTGAAADPTGAIWVAAGAARRTKTASLVGLSDAQVAAAVELAFDAMTDVGDEFTTADTGANLAFTAVSAGVDLTKPVSMLADDSSAGAVTVAETTPGSFTASYEIENNMLGGTDTVMWPLARVVVTMGAASTATVSNVYITRRL